MKCQNVKHMHTSVKCQVSSSRMANLLSNASRRTSNMSICQMSNVKCQNVKMSNVKLREVASPQVPGQSFHGFVGLSVKIRGSLSFCHSIKPVLPRVCETCLPLTPAMKVKMQVNSAVTRRCLAKEIGHIALYKKVGIKLHFHLVHSRLEHLELLLLHN